MISGKKFRKLVRRSVFPVIFSFLLMSPGISGADDTEIYSYSSSEKPMVLIIMDNSGSMADGVPYDSSTTYSGSYDSTLSYLKTTTCTRKNGKQTCTTTYTVYTGTFTDANGDGVDDNNSNIYSGNYLNYYSSSPGTKIDTAKTVLTSLVKLLYDQVQFGLMVFNTEDGGNLGSPIGATESTLLSKISSMTASTWTPLAETLTTAGEYFEGSYSGQSSPWTSSNWCQKAFVIIVTDGMPTHDTSTTILSHFLAKGKTIPSPLPSGKNLGSYWDQDGDYNYDSSTVTDSKNVDVWVKDNTYSDDVPQTFLDDVSYYLYHNDLMSDVSGTQNITTYTIGFTTSNSLLQKTASNGGGTYYTASTASELEGSLLSAMSEILSTTQTFTAPVVPVTKSASGDRMYLAFFKPSNYSTFWAGDLQKYGLSDSNTIVDKNGNAATDSSGAMLSTAAPYWSVNSLLYARTTDRNIYTYLGTDVDLTAAANVFSTSNTALTATVLGSPSTSGNSTYSAKDNLIRYIQGYDSYDLDGDSNYTEKRDNILGDILHSVPLVVDYASSSASDPNRYIFFGSNDGMLHCIKDSDGSEAWAFVPPDILPKLKNFQEGSTHPYFVDGSPKLYQERNSSGAITKAIVIFGERAGGTNYYALDVTTPTSPKFLWNISSSTTGFSEMGQTWSDPVIGKVKKKVASVETAYQAAIFGAGFDSSQSGNTGVSAASAGRGVFMVNVLDGSLIASFTHTTSNGMNYSIPSGILAVDRDYDGIIDRIYVGDTGGNLWRIASATGTDDLIDDWEVRKLFASQTNSSSTPERKIFYPPDIAVMSGYDFLYFATGDRDNPRSTATTDRVYGIKDYSPEDGAFTTLYEKDLTDQTGVSTSYTVVTTSGWYFRLTNSGEKSLAASVLFNGYVLTTTFTPYTGTCVTGGLATLYATYYLSGTTTYYSLGTGIPTEVVLVVRSSGVTAFVGAGGGVRNVRDLTPDSSSTNKTAISTIFDINTGVVPISWREVF